MRSNSLILSELPILIVGQGLAGTVLAWQLLDAGFRVKIIDAGFENTASAVAAGIVNPITGKRFVKTWGLEEQFFAAKNFYESLAERLGCGPIFQEREILKCLPTVKEANDWAARAAFPENKNWMRAEAEAAEFEPFLASKNEAFGALRGGQIDLKKMLSESKKAFVEKGIFSTQVVDYERVTKNVRSVLNASDVQVAPIFYENEPFRKIIFCEGKQAAANPFFEGQNCGWRLAKGEAFLARIDGLETERLLKKNILVAPVGKGLFWVGATYEWDFGDEKPSEKQQKSLEQELFELIGPRFRVEKRLAAVRPTTIDRRPVIGWSRAFPSVGIFNGLGTKGSLMAPFWAAHFLENIVSGTKIDAEVDVLRFLK